MKLLVLCTAAVTSTASWVVARLWLRRLRHSSHTSVTLCRTMMIPVPPVTTQPVITPPVRTTKGQAVRSSTDASVSSSPDSKHIKVYLLPEDTCTCERVLQELLPQLLGTECHTHTKSGPVMLSGNASGLEIVDSTAGGSAANTVQHSTDSNGGQVAIAATVAVVAAAAQQASLPSPPSPPWVPDVRPVVKQVVGLDAEWQPELILGQRSRVSVLQLCGPNWCLVCRPDHMTHGPPPQLLGLLKDSSVSKVGVGIKEDCKRLEADWGVIVKGVVDVRLVTQVVAPVLVMSTGGSLSALAEALLGVELDKRQQCSAWGDKKLTRAQITYAVHDAWASRAVALSLLSSAYLPQTNTAHPSPTLNNPTHSITTTTTTTTTIPDSLTDQPPPPLTLDLLNAFLAPFLDIHKLKHAQKAIRAAPEGSWPFTCPDTTQLSAGLVSGVRGVNNTLQGGVSSVISSSMERHGVDGEGSVMRFRKSARHGLRRTVLYENCRIQAPDGGVLCTCNHKKIQWYLDRSLGVIVSEKPLTLRLHFEPRGRGHQDDDYYTADKLNQCVVCGATSSANVISGDGGGSGGSADNGAQHDGDGGLAEGDSMCGGTSRVSSSGLCVLEDGTWGSGVGSHSTPSPTLRVGREMEGRAGNGGDERDEVGASTSQEGSGLRIVCVSEKDPQMNDRGDDGGDGGRGEGGDRVEGGSHRSASLPPTSQPYLRHSIVPQCYRKCFPLSYKSHLSHDIVLLCLTCHQICGVHNSKRMAELGRMYNAPLHEDNLRFKNDTVLGQVRSAARALLNTKVRLPEARHVELLRVVADHYSVTASEVDEEMLNNAAHIDSRKPAGEWCSHAQRVVNAVQGDIEQFVRGWRSHFLDVMKPRFMPPHWDVCARVANSTVKQPGNGHAGSGPAT